MEVNRSVEKTVHELLTCSKCTRGKGQTHSVQVLKTKNCTYLTTSKVLFLYITRNISLKSHTNCWKKKQQSWTRHCQPLVPTKTQDLLDEMKLRSEGKNAERYDHTEWWGLLIHVFNTKVSPGLSAKPKQTVRWIFSVVVIFYIVVTVEMRVCFNTL